MGEEKNMLLNAEELLSVAEFQQTGETDQLLAPDLTNLSQYWYRKDTQQTLMEEIEAQTDENAKIAIIAAPTLYCHMCEMNPNLAKRCVLFEFDMRFSVYGEQFTFYDINEPLGEQVLKMAQNSFDFIIADPPFWMEEYLEKLLMTIEYLASDNAKTLVCAGPPMIPFMAERRFELCPFRPTYERRLSKYPSNQSRVYANYHNYKLLQFDNS